MINYIIIPWISTREKILSSYIVLFEDLKFYVLKCLVNTVIYCTYYTETEECLVRCISNPIILASRCY